jgi:hypothetical protein
MRAKTITLGQAGAAALEIVANRRRGSWIQGPKEIRPANAASKAKAARMAEAETWIAEVKARRP